MNASISLTPASSLAAAMRSASATLKASRLLAQHVLAGARSSNRPLGVEVVGQRNVDRVHVRVGQQRSYESVRPRDAQLVGDLPRALAVARGDGDNLARVLAAAHAGNDLLAGDVGRGQDTEAQAVHPASPRRSLLTGRKATSRMRSLRGRVSTKMTVSATSSGCIMPASWGISGVRPRPIAKSVATPPGQTFVQRTPRSRSSWSRARVRPTWANFEAQ